MSLTKEQFLSAGLKLPQQEVDAGEFGKVWLRVMPASEKEAYELLLMPGGKFTLPKNYKAKLLRRCIVDANGALMFDEKEEVTIGSLNSALIDALYIKAMQLNGMMPGALEDAVKNSESGQNGDSPSVSPQSLVA